VNCPTCARECRDDARFCDGCGGRLAVACPACSRELHRRALLERDRDEFTRMGATGHVREIALAFHE
jgi:predicted amidophosphoribosyltransferase